MKLTSHLTFNRHPILKFIKCNANLDKAFTFAELQHSYENILYTKTTKLFSSKLLLEITTIFFYLQYNLLPHHPSLF